MKQAFQQDQNDRCRSKRSRDMAKNRKVDFLADRFGLSSVKQQRSDLGR
jgi:hypothetical protein